eukprot:6058225-Pyramimonas_sp.AAC.1
MNASPKNVGPYSTATTHTRTLATQVANRRTNVSRPRNRRTGAEGGGGKGRKRGINTAMDSAARHIRGSPRSPR